MKIYWKKLGEHIHCKVFVNHALAGTLIFRPDEFEKFKITLELGSSATRTFGAGVKITFTEE